MRIRHLLCFVVVSMMAPAHGATVAFLELYDDDGELKQLEPNGRYGHIAIRVGDYWLHAHPEVDVTLSRDLAPYGDNMITLTNPAIPDPSLERVRYYLGLKFNHDFEWNLTDDGTTYCSRLVGELLGIPPEPALFAAEIWEGHQPKPGAVGLSPDDVYREILKLGFTHDQPCQTHFLN